MSKFKLEINVEPNDIPTLDDAHKKDCADAIIRVQESVFKYTLISSAGVMLFYGAYALFGFTYLMRMGKNLPSLSAVMAIAAAAVFILEFFAGTMRKFVLGAEVLLYAVVVYTSLTVLQSVWIAPFAVYGAFLHIKLMSLHPYYKVISELDGFPDFTPLPSREDIVTGKLEWYDPDEDENAEKEETGEPSSESENK